MEGTKAGMYQDILLFYIQLYIYIIIVINTLSYNHFIVLKCNLNIAVLLSDWWVSISKTLCAVMLEHVYEINPVLGTGCNQFFVLLLRIIAPHNKLYKFKVFFSSAPHIRYQAP